MVSTVLFSSNTDNWATPQTFFNELDKEFNFTLDPCSSDENHKCFNYFTKEQDGLSQKWFGRVFCNPPYGRTIGLWVEKAYTSVVSGDCELCVMLIPARTDTKWFHKYLYLKDNVELRFVKGRLKFGDSKASAPFPSMIVVIRNS